MQTNGNAMVAIGRPRVVVAVVALAIIACAACLVLRLHTSGELPLVWQARSVTHVQREQGHAYNAELGTSAMSSTQGPSVAQVLEDGKPLCPGNSLHARIREEGKGCFSFWNKDVLFSTWD